MATAARLRILITGGAGMVGTRLGAELRARGHTVIAVDIKKQPDVFQVDLRAGDLATDLLASHRPDLILHLAALKDLSFCEAHPEASHAVNYQIAERLATACASDGTRLSFFSSDYVFGSSAGA